MKRNDFQSRENQLTRLWRKWTWQFLSIWTFVCYFGMSEILGELQEDRLA